MTSDRPHRLPGQIAVVMAGTILVFVLTLGVSVLWMVHAMDWQARADSARHVETALSTLGSEMLAVTLEYARWDDLVLAMEERGDVWLYRNMGMTAASGQMSDLVILWGGGLTQDTGWLDQSPAAGQSRLVSPRVLALAERRLTAEVPSRGAHRGGRRHPLLRLAGQRPVRGRRLARRVELRSVARRDRGGTHPAPADGPPDHPRRSGRHRREDASARPPGQPHRAPRRARGRAAGGRRAAGRLAVLGCAQPRHGPAGPDAARPAARHGARHRARACRDEPVPAQCPQAGADPGCGQLRGADRRTDRPAQPRGLQPRPGGARPREEEGGAVPRPERVQAYQRQPGPRRGGRGRRPPRPTARDAGRARLPPGPDRRGRVRFPRHRLERRVPGRMARPGGRAGNGRAAAGGPSPPAGAGRDGPRGADRRHHHRGRAGPAGRPRHVQGEAPRTRTRRLQRDHGLDQP